MAVIWLKEPLKFFAVVSSSEGTFASRAEGMQISAGFHSLVLRICVQIDNSGADQNESKTAKLTEMNRQTFPAQRRVLEGFKRKALDYHVLQVFPTCVWLSSLFHCWAWRFFFPPLFKWLLWIRYFAISLRAVVKCYLWLKKKSTNYPDHEKCLFYLCCGRIFTYGQFTRPCTNAVARCASWDKHP